MTRCLVVRDQTLIGGGGSDVVDGGRMMIDGVDGSAALRLKAVMARTRSSL